ncbi:MBL fold metallo-hydrolase [Candidatus Pacearchaeota archaeon]|nr:MBL fold metallo-hydrolase [Candidatus Pacearchaeota archaeon]
MVKIKDIEIEYLGHSGFLIKTEAKIIIIDPYNLSQNVPQADLILITHPHYDHCSIKDIQKIAKPNSVVIIPADAQSKITKIENLHLELIESGDNLEIQDIKIQAVPAYNKTKDFHPKREGWLGYIIKFQDVIIYHAGDTDVIPEMKNLTGYAKKDNQFITLLPVSGEFTMDAEQAAETASLLNPTLAIPMHYGAGVAGTIEDAQRFLEKCRELNVHAQILEKI